MYYVYIVEIRGRWFAIKILGGTEADSLARAKAAYQNEGTVTKFGETANAAEGDELYDKAVKKAISNEKKLMKPEVLF